MRGKGSGGKGSDRERTERKSRTEGKNIRGVCHRLGEWFWAMEVGPEPRDFTPALGGVGVATCPCKPVSVAPVPAAFVCTPNGSSNAPSF